MRRRKPLRIAVVGVPVIALDEERYCTGLARYAKEHGAWRYVFSSEATVDSIRFLPKVNCDGAVVRLVSSEMAREASKLRLPMVNISTWLANPGIPTVCSDDRALGRLAAEHLLARGFRKFACVSCPGGWYVGERSRGFIEKIKEHGFPCSTHRIKPHLRNLSDPQLLKDADCHHLEAWLQQLHPQVGLFWTEDHLGGELLQACRNMGLRVPQDIAVVSSPNRRSLCEAFDPPLSSVDAPMEDIGYAGALLLDRLISGLEMPATRQFVPVSQVVARKSSDTYAAENPSVAHALNYIHENIGSPINASDVVHQVDLPRRTFYRLFKETTGKSPKQFIQDRRIALAKEILSAQPELAISEVARRCGFLDRHRMGQTLHRMGI